MTCCAGLAARRGRCAGCGAPELEALRGVEQSRFHHLDVYEHTLAVLEQVIALGHGFAEAEPRRGRLRVTARASRRCLQSRWPMI